MDPENLPADALAADAPPAPAAMPEIIASGPENRINAAIDQWRHDTFANTRFSYDTEFWNLVYGAADALKATIATIVKEH